MRLLWFALGLWLGLDVGFVLALWWVNRRRTGDGLANAELARMAQLQRMGVTPMRRRR